MRITVVVALLALSWVSLMACQRSQPVDGAGGQSGDEGRKPRDGSGGASAGSPPPGS
jgi:hypothetical protein